MSLLKVNEIQIFNGENVTITAPAVITANDNTNAALRITQTGTGNALVVEDSSPDSTPFVVDAAGRVILGDVDSLTYSTSLSITPPLQLNSTGSFPIGISRFSNNSGSPGLFFLKSRGESTGSFDLVAQNDNLGTFLWMGSDGSDGIAAAAIEAEVDGTPGTNDMPGRLIFYTTADGASTLTERMRIDSSGNVGIGTTSPNSKLNVSTNSTDAAVTITQTGSGNALVVEDSANPDSTPFVVDSAGHVGVSFSSTQTTPDAFLQVGIGNRTANSYTFRPTVLIGERPNGDNLSQIDFSPNLTTGNGVSVSVNSSKDFTISTVTSGSYSERMRIDSSGNVGIGTSSPSQKLDVTGNINATGALTLGTALAVAEGGTGVTSLGSLDAADLGSGSATDGYVLTADGAGGAAWEAKSPIDLLSSGASIRKSDGTTAVLSESGGAVTLENVADAYLSGGVYLGGTGAANYLNDYEEGTWTPVFRGATTAGTYTYANGQVGRYTKVGNSVTIHCNLFDITEVSAGSGVAQVSGLPFTSSNISSLISYGAVNLSRFNLNGEGQVVRILYNTSIADFLLMASGAGSGALLDVGDRTGNLSDIGFTITYQTSA